MTFNYLPVVFLLLMSMTSCGTFDKGGESLAKRHCSTCHAFPEPSLLTKRVWETGVLPEMAYRMGLDVSKLPMATPDELNEILTALPPTPLVTEDQWKIIKEYYLNNAPDSVSSPPQSSFLPVQQFDASIASLPVSNNTSLTMIKFDGNTKDFFIGTRRGKLFQLTGSLQLKDSVQLNSPPSDILFSHLERPLLSCMGNMDPNDQKTGSVIRLTEPGQMPVTLIDSLKRPVNLQKADLNNDGQDDLVVSAFGNFTGMMLCFEKKKGEYIRHVIHTFPGTRKTIVRDFNDDGLPDILSLITQGDEQIALFTNRGQFRFSYQVLLKFPPVYGSSYFELKDFNADGYPDILYTNGDNADFSATLKPYHGLRIFLNDGENHFNESWFQPMHGASMAKASDFDQDGDVDIAAISFFPDFKNHPEHSFIYFENQNGNFRGHTTPLAASSRWITMESNDFDHDGDQDVILASLNFPNGVPAGLFQEWKQKQASLLIFKNKLH